MKCSDMTNVTEQKWAASQILDDGRWGVVTVPTTSTSDDCYIVIPLRAKLSEEQVRIICEYHNSYF